MNDDGNVIKRVELTEDQYRELLESIRRVAVDRRRSIGPAGFSSMDFLCGALSVFYALGIKAPHYLILAMSGRDWLEDADGGN